LKTETIVLKLKNGDTQALRFVYELFYKPTFQAALFITNDIGLAEDAVHEVFLKVQNKIEQLQDPSKLETWLCRMASNTARDIIRHRSKSALFPEARDIYLDNQLISPETVLLDKEKKQIIQHLIRNLQPEYKSIIYLKYYADMSVNEISTTLEIPVGTVKSRLIRAREGIKKLLNPEDHLNRHKINRLIEPEEVI